jgi:hypothetical protein
MINAESDEMAESERATDRSADGEETAANADAVHSAEAERDPVGIALDPIVTGWFRADSVDARELSKQVTRTVNERDSWSVPADPECNELPREVEATTSPETG